MPSAMLKYLTALCYLGLCLCTVRECPTYEDTVRPLIVANDIRGLQGVFKVMNNDTRSVPTFRVFPIDNTVWPEVTAIKMLISLSKPQLEKMGNPDLWPENNNIRVFLPGAANVFTPTSTYHGGIRYIYNCVTLQTITLVNPFVYQAEVPIFKRSGEEIYVPRENLVAANGDAMSDHEADERVDPRREVFLRFGRMTLRECSARQVFFEATDPKVDCFDSLKFFSLPEEVQARSASEDVTDPNKYVPESVFVTKQFFVVLN